MKYNWNKAGSILIEAAITLPILILLILGIVQYAMIMSAQLTLVNGAAVASRSAIVTPAPDCAATTAVAKADIAMSLNPDLLSVVCENITTGPLTGAVRVNLSYPLTLLFPQVVYRPTVNGVLTLTASCTSR